LCLALALPPVFAEGLSTSISDINSGRFPVVNTHLKIFCKEPVALTREDFTLSEDGKPVKDFSVTIAKPVQYYMLTIDRSSSIKEDMPVIKQAVLQFLQTIPAEVHIGVISFASDVQLEHEFSLDRNSIFQAVQNIRAWGGTTLFDSIFDGVQRLQNTGKSSDQKTIVCLSDGADMNPRGTGPMSQKTLPEVTEFARKNSIRVIAIGLGNDIDEVSLKAIAQQTNGAYLCAPTVQQLAGAYQAVSRRARLESFYSVEHTSPRPERDGTTRKIQISSRFKGMQDQGNGTYVAPTIPEPEPARAKKPEKKWHGIKNRPHGIESRPHGIGHRVFEPPDEPGYQWIGNKDDGIRIQHLSSLKEYEMVTFKNGQPNGLVGSWLQDGSPTGYHGTMVDGKWHGQRICIHSRANRYDLETFEHGVRHGRQESYDLDGSPDGYFGEMVDGKWHGQRICIHSRANSYDLETFEHGVEHGPQGSYDMDGIPSGYFGEKFNGEWHGDRIYVHPRAAKGWSCETFDQGASQGPAGIYDDDGNLYVRPGEDSQDD
jgi:hypothetical protein